jgi:hypothetical protein
MRSRPQRSRSYSDTRNMHASCSNILNTSPVYTSNGTLTGSLWSWTVRGPLSREPPLPAPAIRLQPQQKDKGTHTGCHHGHAAPAGEDAPCNPPLVMGQLPLSQPCCCPQHQNTPCEYKTTPTWQLCCSLSTLRPYALTHTACCMRAAAAGEPPNCQVAALACSCTLPALPPALSRVTSTLAAFRGCLHCQPHP